MRSCCGFNFHFPNDRLMMLTMFYVLFVFWMPSLVNKLLHFAHIWVLCPYYWLFVKSGQKSLIWYIIWKYVAYHFYYFTGVLWRSEFLNFGEVQYIIIFSLVGYSFCSLKLYLTWDCKDFFYVFFWKCYSFKFFIYA